MQRQQRRNREEIRCDIQDYISLDDEDADGLENPQVPDDDIFLNNVSIAFSNLQSIKPIQNQ